MSSQLICNVFKGSEPPNYHKSHNACSPYTIKVYYVLYEFLKAVPNFSANVLLKLYQNAPGFSTTIILLCLRLEGQG